MYGIMQNIIRNVFIMDRRSLIFENDKIECLNVCKRAFKKYKEHGSRSNKKTNEIHNYYCNMINKIITSPSYHCVTEYNVNSHNYSNKKKCDIVLLKNKEPCAIFPVKFVISNYKQNRNNYWENLTGEATHLKMIDNNLKIIPINIFLKQCPYFTNNKVCKNFEKYDKDIFKMYKTERGLPFDGFINILINNDGQWDNENLFSFEYYTDIRSVLKKIIDNDI